MPGPAFVSVAVEGTVDEAAVRRIAGVVGFQIMAVYGLKGQQWLLPRLSVYNEAARHANWLVLLDVNSRAACAPHFLQDHFPSPSSGMRLRLAVRAVESWLLSDRQRMAHFLSVAEGRLPDAPDLEADPKRSLVEIARHSRSRDVREAIVPMPMSGRSVGPGYVGKVLDFVARWDPVTAAEASDSLRRCLAALNWQA